MDDTGPGDLPESQRSQPAEVPITFGELKDGLGGEPRIKEASRASSGLLVNFWRGKIMKSLAYQPQVTLICANFYFFIRLKFTKNSTFKDGVIIF